MDKTDKNDNDLNAVSLNVNLDTTPILYTDNIVISSNEDGIVLDICQRVGTTRQWRIVSRIGMSRSQAKKFLQALGKQIDVAEGRVQTGKKVIN